VVVVLSAAHEALLVSRRQRAPRCSVRAV
jgi:hypothetical protein